MDSCSGFASDNGSPCCGSATPRKNCNPQQSNRGARVISVKSVRAGPERCRGGLRPLGKPDADSAQGMMIELEVGVMSHIEKAQIDRLHRILDRHVCPEDATLSDRDLVRAVVARHDKHMAGWIAGPVD